MPTNISLPPVDARLLSAARFTRGGAVADVGTDHAYLPAWLLLEGRISGGVATDINPGPLERAAATLRKYSIEDKIALRLTDGLRGIEEFSPRDIIIFGMGGELICSILAAAEWVKNPDIRLILQPMTRRAELRSWLLSQGFFIVDEAESEVGGRIYQTVCAEYDGIDRTGDYDVAELLIGRHNIKRCGKLTLEYTKNLYDIYSARRAGKLKSGADTSEEDEVLAGLDRLLGR